jgi:hypothetical protein
MVSTMPTFNADVAELVDAQRSGRCGSNLVEVRVLSSASRFSRGDQTLTAPFVFGQDLLD